MKGAVEQSLAVMERTEEFGRGLRAFGCERSDVEAYALESGCAPFPRHRISLIPQ